MRTCDYCSGNPCGCGATPQRDQDWVAELPLELYKVLLGLYLTNRGLHRQETGPDLVWMTPTGNCHIRVRK